jgi:outer membrane autotransporter protein
LGCGEAREGRRGARQYFSGEALLPARHLNFRLLRVEQNDSMREGMKNLPISSLALLAIFIAQAASAQTIVNGSFTATPLPSPTGAIVGWSSAGDPSISMGPNPGEANDGPVIPVPGTYEALINSTGSSLTSGALYYGIYGPQNSASAGALESFLGTTLPNSANGNAAFNGEAIQQTFTTLGSATVSFYYSYQSRETPGDPIHGVPPNGADNTGYVLNGTFNTLANTTTNSALQKATQGGASGFFVWFLPYTKDTLLVGPGTNTLSFVVYNTGDGASPTGLFLDDIVLTPIFGSDPGLTPNQIAVANYIDTFNNGTVGGNFATLITELTGATTVTALGQYLDQISPQSLQVFRSIAFDNATFTTLDVTNHLANLRDGLTGFDPSQLTVTDGTLSPGASQINNRLRDMKEMQDMKEMRDPKEMQPVSTSEPADRWSSFIVGNVILADLSHDQDLAHQEYTTGSVMLGLDYRLDEHWTVGALLAYSHTDADLDHIGSTATVDTYSPGVYASYVDGGWYGNALFTYGYNSYTENRNISIGDLTGTNTGAPQGNQYTGSLVGGYEFRSGDFKYGPIAGVQYVNLGINSFSEEGPTALNVQSESDESFRSQLGVEARYVMHAGSICLTPHASATWQHEFLDDSNGITSQFNQIGAGSFTVETTTTDRDSAVIDAGLNADVAENVTLFTDYQTEAGEANYFAQSVQAGVKIGF